MARNKTSILSGCTKEVKASKFVDRNTLRIEYADGSVAIRLHDTDIVTRDSEGNTLISSGGWRTDTTKDRISRYGLIYISQVKGIWYVSCKNKKGEDVSTEFYDGMKFSPDLKLLTAEIKTDLTKVEKIKKEISKFVSLITKENLPIPDGGDCWLCCMRTKEGQTMGELGSNNAEHLHQHIKEKYLHGSLLVNAMRERGYADEQIRTHYSLRIADTFKRALRTYLQRKLIPNISVR